MKLTRRSSLRTVALAVGRALGAHGIRAVLTGGACASIHSDGRFVSEDVDFVLEGRVLPADLDEAMSGLGFVRLTNRYVHPHSRFWVEFPRGPLAVGADLDLQPIRLGPGKRGVPALSATDSCRDRLAAFYHWSDRQSLEVAIAIAATNDIDLELVRRWSADEGHSDRFAEFLSRIERRPLPRTRRRSQNRRAASPAKPSRGRGPKPRRPPGI